MSIVKVAVENTNFSFDMLFDYFVPSHLEENVSKGSCVLVPFGRGNKTRIGFVFEVDVLTLGNTKGLKCIERVIDETPSLNEEQIELALWLKERTFCTLYDAVKAMLPSGITCRVADTYSIDTKNCPESLPENDEERLFFEYVLSKKSPVESDKLRKTFGYNCDKVAESLVSQGYLQKCGDAFRKAGDMTKRMVRLCSDEENIENTKLSPKQKNVVSLLQDIGCASIKEICYFTGYTNSVITSLEKKHIVEVFDTEIYRTPYKDTTESPFSDEIVLTDEQETAFRNLSKLYSQGKPAASLLYGVTGSGKTKVYLKLIEKVLESNRGVILMVPEIALTPQTVKLLHKKFGSLVAVFHSALSVGERLDEWKRVKNGDALIAVGTRSAVFAPFDNPGLIIIDEEQEGAYKSDSSPRYNAKDVAKFRCNYHGSLLLLASATPSIESFSAAVRGKYSLNTLEKRYGNAVLPEVETIDMCLERRMGNAGELSNRLVESVKENISNNKQSILLINRRGYNTYASCVECGHTIMCPSCSIPMTYHHANSKLMCHYCGYSVNFTVNCPVCEKKSLHYFGFGTQKIEDELQSLIPEARILRMDADTTMSKFSHEKKFESFSKGEYDILIGTQMVAKGLDFENVTLVGVVSVDQQLYNDDYRSLERTFDLLMQVVGRSGRGKYPGKAIIQTMSPENEIIRLAAKQDYRAFYDTEIDIRRMLVYPPYCDICTLNFLSSDELKVKATSKLFLSRITELTNTKYLNEKMIVLGPLPARVTKINNKYRYRIILKIKNTTDFRKMIAELLVEFGKSSKYSDVTIYPDMNPESLL